MVMGVPFFFFLTEYVPAVPLNRRTKLLADTFRANCPTILYVKEVPLYHLQQRIQTPVGAELGTCGYEGSRFGIPTFFSLSCGSSRGRIIKTMDILLRNPSPDRPLMDPRGVQTDLNREQLAET